MSAQQSPTITVASGPTGSRRLAARSLARAAVGLLLAAAAFGFPVAADASGSADRGQIVWTLGETGSGPGHLVTARADGSRQRNLTPPLEGVLDIDAAISPDGKWVAFERQTDTVGAEVRLVRSGGGPMLLLGLGCVDPCIGDSRPTWLGPDRIAFTRYTESPDLPFGYDGVLWSVRVRDGAVAGALSRVSPVDGDGLWEDLQARPTPDGRHLVFMRFSTETGDGAAFRMDREARHVQQLTPWELQADLPHPSPARVGPTAGLVVFQTYGEGNPNGTSRDLATVPVSCRSLQACTAAIRYVTHNGMGTGRASNPTWSPDGSRIAFAARPSSVDNNAQIVTIRADGTGTREISTSSLFDYRPDWGVRSPSPDRDH